MTLVQHVQSGSGPAVESVPEQLQCLCCARGLKLLGTDVRCSMLLQDGEVARPQRIPQREMGKALQ